MMLYSSKRREKKGRVHVTMSRSICRHYVREPYTLPGPKTNPGGGASEYG